MGLAKNLLAAPMEEAPTDWRGTQPRYQGDNYQKNKELASKIAAMAEKKGKTAAQLSLAWLYYKAKAMGVPVLPLPGTTKMANAQDNIGSLAIELVDEEVVQLEAFGALVSGQRADEDYQSMGIERFGDQP